MKLIYCLLSILIVTASNAQTKIRAKPKSNPVTIASKNAQTRTPLSFPASFAGVWSGKLHWYPVNKASQIVDMQLHILPADTAGQYTWRIVYGNPGTDDRPYVLKAVDTAAKHWIVDERNGILLDGYWIHDRFVSSFSVGNTTITDSYALNGEEMVVEFYSTQKTPISKTGKGTEESPAVESYRVSSYQRAVLRKRAK